MSLRSKFLSQQLVLLVSLLAVAVAAILGLLQARDLVEQASLAHERVQMAAEARAAAEGFLTGLADVPPRSDPYLLSQSVRVLRRLTANLKEGEDEDNPPFASVAMDRLELARTAATRAPPDLDAARTQAREAMPPIQLVSQFYASRTTEVQMAADALVRRMLIVLTGVTLSSAVAALVVASKQYSGVMQPLGVIRDGVRRLARGQFGKPIVVKGDVEMLELATDFNHMASELEELYLDLEHQVDAKSRELVRSERLASVGYLAAGVAHEINNPLGIISGYAELAERKLARSDRPSDSVNKSLQIIREEAFRCKQITSRLLSLARGGGDDRSLLNMVEIVNEVAGLVHVLHRFRDRTIDLPIEKSPPLMVVANAGEMKQVLLNLMVNALEFSRPVDGRVTVEGRVDDGSVEIDVTDNGRGMTPETLDRIFEPFYSDRNDNPDRGPEDRGVGLGLSISLAIVENHTGQLKATSAGIGHGSRFTIRLPAAEPAKEET